jgi:hypothetical protein
VGIEEGGNPVLKSTITPFLSDRDLLAWQMAFVLMKTIIGSSPGKDGQRNRRLRAGAESALLRVPTTN